MRSILLCALLVSSAGYAEELSGKSALPAETRGDPAPDTAAAESWLKRGRYEDAIRTAKLALGRDEKYVPAMVVLAKAYYYQRKYELANSIIDIAKSIDANNADLYNLTGFIALANNDRISATAAFKKATELKDNFPAAWNNLTGQYLFAKNYDGAITTGEKAVQLAPNFAKAHLNLGSAYRGKQRYADADREYKKALDIDANYADAYFNLGILYLDAKEMPNTALIDKLNASINYFNRYKQASSFRLSKDDPADTYINEARTGIDRENKRLERLKRQQQRGEPKAAEKPEGGTAAPAKPETK